jgi:hypothetical protein
MSSGKSSRSDEAADIQAEDAIPSSERKFPLNSRIPGNDALNAPDCIVNDSLCDLCFLFIKTLLSERIYGHRGSRLAWKQCSPTTSWLVFRHYTSFRMLKDSAKAGCELCSKMLESSQLEEDDQMVFACSGRSWYTGDIGLYGEEERHWFTFSILPLRSLTRGLAEDKNIKFEFVLAKDELDCLKMPYDGRCDLRRFPSLCPYSQECFDQIRRWQDNCTKKHIRCFRRDLPLPSRLLDLLPTTNYSKTERITLVEPRDLSKPLNKVRYVALSYCWGEWTGLVTKRGNLANMMHSISLEDLPAVVKDAIYVCRKYGIRYLWVDALCICQDDTDEWQSEAANMANVYGGCEFALSALSSSKASEGFLRERYFKPLALGNARVSYGTWWDSVTLFIRRRPRSLRDEFTFSPLNQRAWPLQEKILAPAVLHYGRDQVIWECNTDHLSAETGEITSESEMVIRISDMVGADSSLGIRTLWECIVEEFTRRKLTYAKDRLLAICGMASKLREDGTYSGRYVAGLWESDLESQLMWRATDITRTTSFEPVQPNLQIPTWSWAHRNLPVETVLWNQPTSALSNTAKFFFKDYDEEKKSQSGNTVGNCAVTMCGFVQKVSEKAISLDGRPLKRPSGDTIFFGLPGHNSKWWFDQEPLAPGPYYCLRVLDAAQSTLHSDFELPSIIYYLVLRKADTTEITEVKSLYVRVGVLTLNEVSDENLAHPYPDVFCKNGKPLLTDGEWEDVVLI